MDRISDLERRYVQEVLDSHFRASAGIRMTGRLEAEFARQFGCRFAISFINGTATMHAALAAAGVGPGDEVIVPPLTMASTSFAVLHAGARPVFADIDPRTWTLDPESLEERVTPRTKAVIPVSIYGLAPALDAIMEIARRHRLFVLEDDAQCFLGYCQGCVVGSIGHAASFSFQGSKHMASGEGGMVTTSDPALADRIRRFGSLGYGAVSGEAGRGKISKDAIQDPAYERHHSVGWNYRMPELCAAVALGQLQRLTELVEMRKRVASLYAEAIRDVPWLVPQEVPEGSVHSWWSYVLALEPSAPARWHDFRRRYIELGGDGIYGAWLLTYQEPAFRSRGLGGCCPVAESIQPRLLQLKTNYLDIDVAKQKAEALARTVASFG